MTIESQIGTLPMTKATLLTALLRKIAPAAALILALSGSRDPDVLAVVEANDNRTPAGTLYNDTLTLRLVVQMARWYPETADGPFAEVAAFAEEGKAPQVPGPLIRVPEGTTIVASVRNDLADSTIWVRGMATRPAAPDSVPIKPGESRTMTFSAGAPGSYLYYATPGIVNYDIREREQLAGALIIDEKGAKPDDRVIVINIWGEPVDSTSYRNAVAINGKSWPHTERMRASVGDSVRWRVINASVRPHPMHLHGFYFRIDSRGTYLADTAIALAERSLFVTQNMNPGNTMSIVWSPDRTGNWLFHCHLVFHVLEGARLDAHREEHGHAKDLMNHMAGLVMGITVDDSRGLAKRAEGKARKLRLYANERLRNGRTPLHMSYVQQRGSKPPAADSVEPPGMPLVLTRGELAEVTVVNQSHAATSVHWHGLELESFSDGVAGWSGADRNVAPMIAPNDSFTARLTMPRAGTFIYHTHLNDIEQLTSGMYGPIIVLEPGEKYDPKTDHVFTVGWDGAHEPPKMMVNGDTAGTVPLYLERARTHRIRLINIGAAGGGFFAMRQDSVPVSWKQRAKDGADLPSKLRVEGPAIRYLATGETFDAEWAPAAGEYLLTIGGRKSWRYSRKVIVR